AIGSCPIGVDRELVENAIVVDPGLNEKPIRLNEIDAAAGKLHTLRVLTLVAAVSASCVQRLSARRCGLGGAVPHRDDVVEWAVKGRHEVSSLEQADIDFLVPKPEFGPFQVVHQGFLLLAAISVALRQIENVP